MPVLLSNEKSTPYPIKQYSGVDSNRDYFVIRKDKNKGMGKNIGEVKFVYDSHNYIVVLNYFDTQYSEYLGEQKDADKIFEKLMEDFDIIMITLEECEKGSVLGTGFDFDKYFLLRKEVVQRLFNLAEQK